MMRDRRSRLPKRSPAPALPRKFSDRAAGSGIARANARPPPIEAVTTEGPPPAATPISHVLDCAAAALETTTARIPAYPIDMMAIRLVCSRYPWPDRTVRRSSIGQETGDRRRDSGALARRARPHLENLLHLKVASSAVDASAAPIHSAQAHKYRLVCDRGGAVACGERRVPHLDRDLGVSTGEKGPRAVAIDVHAT